jgi:hypothetical protein
MVDTTNSVLRIVQTYSDSSSTQLLIPVINAHMDVQNVKTQPSVLNAIMVFTCNNKLTKQLLRLVHLLMLLWVPSYHSQLASAHSTAAVDSLVTRLLENVTGVQLDASHVVEIYSRPRLFALHAKIGQLRMNQPKLVTVHSLTKLFHSYKRML